MKLSLGPIQYFWSPERVSQFYEQVAQWPVDLVYLGENVCAKRRTPGLTDWLTIAQKLQAAGKEVVLSSLVLLEAASELATLKRICQNENFLVEANDMAAVQLLAKHQAFIVGPHINNYNGETLHLLAGLGAVRWVMPVELSRETLAALQACRPDGMQTEVLVFGRLPLAFSARCFTARAKNLPKDQCGFCCQHYPDGMLLATQENQPLFTLNGIQIQSSVPCNLLGMIEQLDELNVDVLRIYPQAQNTLAVIEAFRACLGEHPDPQEAIKRLAHLKPDSGWCNGYWYGKAGMRWLDNMTTVTGIERPA